MLKNLKKNAKFAPAKVTSDFHYKKTFGGAGYDLLYYVNNKKYKRTISKGTFIKGRTYLVAYDSQNFSLGTLFDIDITDSLYQYPQNGWTLKEIPFKIDTVYIKKKIEEL